MVADIEESWTLQKSIFEDSMQEKCVRHKGVKTLCSVVGGTAKLSGRDYKFQVPTLRREQLVRVKMISGEKFKETRRGLNRQKQKMTFEAQADIWSIPGDFIYRHHNELRVQLYAPKEETFLIPLE